MPGHFFINDKEQYRLGLDLTESILEQMQTIPDEVNHLAIMTCNFVKHPCTLAEVLRNIPKNVKKLNFSHNNWCDLCDVPFEELLKAFRQLSPTVETLSLVNQGFGIMKSDELIEFFKVLSKVKTVIFYPETFGRKTEKEMAEILSSIPSSMTIIFEKGVMKLKEESIDDYIIKFFKQRSETASVELKKCSEKTQLPVGPS